MATGLTVTGGLSVLTDGVIVSGGGAVLTGGMSVTDGVSVGSGGIVVTGGVTVHGTGLTVTGGITVGAGGMTTAQGITVTTGGISTDAGATVQGGGLEVVGGITVDSGGAMIKAGGLTIVDTGVLVTSGGMTVLNDGLTITAGGMSVNSGGVVLHNGGMTVTGTVTLATSPTITSDRRLKTNVSSIDNALEMLQGLNGVTYSWLQPGNLNGEEDAARIGRSLTDMLELKRNLEGVAFDTLRHVGLLAQDVQSVLPEAVQPIHGGKFLGVNYADLVPVLVEAIKALDETVSELQREQEQEKATAATSDSCADLLSVVDEMALRVRDLENKNRELRSKLMATQ